MKFRGVLRVKIDFPAHVQFKRSDRDDPDPAMLIAVPALSQEDC
jgi:hypothetical protein